jgi:hypothetical protein
MKRIRLFITIIPVIFILSGPAVAQGLAGAATASIAADGIFGNQAEKAVRGEGPWVTWMQISLDKYQVQAGDRIRIYLMLVTQKKGPAETVTFNIGIAGPAGTAVQPPPGFSRKFPAGTSIGESGFISFDTAGCAPGKNTVTLTAKDAQGNVVSAADVFTVAESGTTPPPPPPPLVKVVPPPPAAVVYEGSDFGYTMILNIVPDTNGDAVVDSGMIMFGSDTWVVMGGMSSLGLGGTPGGAHFQVIKCVFLGRQVSMDGNFVKEDDPQTIAVPKVGVDHVVIKMSGLYEDNRRPLKNPLTDEPFVVFKLYKRK